jgi:hypothetical protein
MILGLVAIIASAQSVPESQFEWQRDDDEFIPVAFRGTWAPTLADCKAGGAEVFSITAKKLWFYEGDAKLLKMSNVNYTSDPKGRPAYSINPLVAQRELMDLDTGIVRLTLSGGKLYMTRADAVSEDKQWQYANVRCPQ